MKKLGEILIEKGLITEEQLTAALNDQKINGGFLGEALVRKEFISEEKLTEIISMQLNIPIYDVKDIVIEDYLLEKIPANIAKKENVLPIDLLGNSLTVVMANPLNRTLVHDLQVLTGFEIEVMIAPLSEIKETVNNIYKEGEEAEEELTQLMEETIEDVDIVEDQEEVDTLSSADLIKMTENKKTEGFIKLIIINAIKNRASDIHIEPFDDNLIRVRYRIDSVLYEQKKYPISILRSLAVVLKTKTSGCKLDETRKPQNGRFQYNYEGRKLEFRISFVPTVRGERIEIRIMDRKAIELNLNALGFNQRDLKEVKDSLKKPWGMILVVGPTGSGKTTTLYSMLTEMYDDFTNVMTVEEPVEFDLFGINQVNVSVDEEGELAAQDVSREEIEEKLEHQMTFAKALKAFLRQDPDKIMVGEIRDGVTADIAIRAALTGHMVISSLHTNDAPSVITRLMNIGTPYFLIASSLVNVVAQKLMRKICPKCKEEVHYTNAELEQLNISPEEIKDIPTFYRGKGCGFCSNTGYYKRTAIFEVMPITPELQAAIMEKAPVKEIRRIAKEQGMKTLRQQALDKVKEGISTLEEVMRTTSGG